MVPSRELDERLSPHWSITVTNWMLSTPALSLLCNLLYSLEHLMCAIYGFFLGSGQGDVPPPAVLFGVREIGEVRDRPLIDW